MVWALTFICHCQPRPSRAAGSLPASSHARIVIVKGPGRVVHVHVSHVHFYVVHVHVFHPGCSSISLSPRKRVVLFGMVFVSSFVSLAVLFCLSSVCFVVIVV
jgi:hypothetical protein